MTKQEILLAIDRAIIDLRRDFSPGDPAILAQAFIAIREVFEDLLPKFTLAETLVKRPRDWAELWEYVVRELGMKDDDARYIWNNWKANDFTRNGKPIKDWKAAARAWKAGKFYPSQKQK